MAPRCPSEIVGLFGSEDARRSLLRNLPGSLLIGLLGIWLLGRGGHWSNSVIEAGQGMSRAATALIAESFGALLQLALPLAGLFLLLSAVGQSGLLGETGTILFRSLSRAAVLAILGYWLVARIYPVGVEAGTAKSLVLPARLTGFAGAAPFCWSRCWRCIRPSRGWPGLCSFLILPLAI